jgi:hypothetical protein
MGSIIFTNAQPGDIIVVSNFDRAFRSVVDCHETLTTLEEKNIGIVILDVDVNTKTPLGRAFMKIIAVLKELEREEIGRRTRDALQYKKRKEKPISSNCPMGWRKLGSKRDSKFVPEPKNRNWCKLIVKLREEKRLSWNQIHRLLKRKNAVYFSGRGKTWTMTRIRKGYVAAKLGFPMKYMNELPPPREVAPKGCKLIHPLHASPGSKPSVSSSSRAPSRRTSRLTDRPLPAVTPQWSLDLLQGGLSLEGPPE